MEHILNLVRYGSVKKECIYQSKYSEGQQRQLGLERLSDSGRLRELRVFLRA